MTAAERRIVPAAAEAIFGGRLELATRYVELLAGAGVARGLIGPRETERLWERHVLNCAALGELVPPGGRVVDVGSGAGLPGIPLALRRPDLQVELVEPMQRRVAFLVEAVGELALGDQVSVRRGRAEEREIVSAVGGSKWVTARAVAPLDRLVKWCLPLLVPGGRLLALKGARAADEVAAHEVALRRLGADRIEVESIGATMLDEPTWVVSVRRSVRQGSRRERG